MVIWNADHQKAVALDYRERAPAGATAAALQNDDSFPEPPSVRKLAKLWACRGT